MGKQITRAQPTVAGQITSLPPWLAALAGAVGTVQHPGQPVRYHLQTGWVMSNLERAEATSLLSTLTSSLDQTASFEGRDGSEAKGALLTKMIYGLAGPAQQSELAVNSKIEMYADAIEDLPAWSIDKAIRRWGSGTCPASIEETPKYAFPPAPATLRALATLELEIPRRYQTMLKNLIAAIPMDRALNPDPMPAGTALAPTLRRM